MMNCRYRQESKCKVSLFLEHWFFFIPSWDKHIHLFDFSTPAQNLHSGDEKEKEKNGTRRPSNE